MTSKPHCDEASFSADFSGGLIVDTITAERGAGPTSGSMEKATEEALEPSAES